MSELAFNINGEAFEVPANATGWRVRKMRAKGAPEVVYAREGQPLVLPIDADIDDLRTEVETTGRYRLDLVDQNNKAIAGAPSGYVQVNFEVEAGGGDRPSSQSTAISKGGDNVVIEAMRMNAEITKSVVDRFPQMMEAAAMLLRAADGAGIPARLPRVLDVHDHDDDDGGGREDAPPASPGMEFLNTLVSQIVPLVVSAMASKKMPKLGEMLDWRKAAPQHQTHIPEPTHSTEPTREAASTASALPALDPQAMAHFLAIQSALTPEEAALAREVAADLGPAELRTWFEDLSTLTVPAAVAKIRALIGKGGAS